MKVFPLLALVGLVAGYALQPRPVPPDNVIARSEMDVGTNAFVRVLPDGRVFVSDDFGTKVWLLDKDLRNARLIGESAKNFMEPGSYVHPFLGDWTLLLRSGISDGFVLDGQGRKLGEVSLSGGTWGRGPWTIDMIRAPFTKDGELMVLPAEPRLPGATVETVYVVRTSFTNPTHRDTVDTLTRQPPGSTQFLLAGDGAAMLSDGTIAIVRAKDFSLDWIARDGRRWSQRLPHTWTVLGPKDKQEVLDSTRAALGSRRMTLGVADIPDTVPPITWVGTIRADADDQVWIEKIVLGTNPYRPASRGIFDVVDRTGQVRTVRLPRAAVVKAFTPGRVYYALRENGVGRLVVASTK